MRSGLNWCAVKLAEWYLPTCLNFADLTLATSPQLKDQLKELGCRNVEVWRKGIDTDVFSSKFNESNIEMRSIMTDGQPTRPLLLYVGRLGREKNINMIKDADELESAWSPEVHVLPVVSALPGGGYAGALVTF